jgi:hypothetical protein
MKQAGKSLRDFKVSDRSSHIFTDATEELPKFLTTNLVDEARSIKIFKKDPCAYIKTFSFQFFKLCFEAEDVDYDTKLNKFIEMLEKYAENTKLTRSNTNSQEPTIPIKSIVLEFLEVLSECKEPVESTLAKYPELCTIVTNFLCNYLTTHCNIPPSEYNTSKSVKILAELLQVDIVEYDNCIQFTDTQVYSYKNTQDDIYMIYIDETKAMRNTKMEPTDTLNDSALVKYSTKTIEPEHREIIAFGEPDIVFNNSILSCSNSSQSKIAINVDTTASLRNKGNVLLQTPQSAKGQSSSSCFWKPGSLKQSSNGQK